MTETKKWHGNRAMLNLPGYHSTAAIVAEVQDTSSLDPASIRSDWAPVPEVTFQIANCDRSIAFDFYVDHLPDHENNLYKIDTMLAALKEFRRGLSLEQKRYAKKCDEIKKKREQKEDDK